MVTLPWLITLMLSLKFLHAKAVGCYTKFDMQTACHDCCYGTPLDTYNDINSAIACCELCSENEQCRSVQYDDSNKTCWTNGEKMTTAKTSCSSLIQYGEIQLGSCRTHKLFEPCSSDADCVIANSACRNGSCQCKDGHPYDYRFDSCPTGCTKYGNTFHEVLYYIPYKTSSSFTGVSIDECFKLCVKPRRYVCRFVEYKMTPTRCTISTLNALTAGTLPSPAPSWKQWDRDCA